MTGGIIIIGTIAFVVVIGELLTRWSAPAPRYARERGELDLEICAWPRLEPEVERLRRKAAL